MPFPRCLCIQILIVMALHQTHGEQGCGGKLIGEGTIISPGYPSDVPRHTECLWYFTADNGKSVLLDFVDFYVNKPYSDARIVDFSWDRSISLSGNEGNTSLLFSDKIELDFRTLSNYTNRAFSINFKSVAISNATDTSLFFTSKTFANCGSNLTNQGDFASPGYPAAYPNNAYCRWNLSASPGMALQLTCLSINLEAFDFLAVFGPKYNQLGDTYNLFQGNYSNFTLNFGKSASVYFLSDGTGAFTGFAFQFRSVPPPGFNQSIFTEATVPTAMTTVKPTPQSGTMSSATSAATTETASTAQLTTISTNSGFTSQPLSSIHSFLACGGSLDLYGEIWSPNFPSTYPNNVTCIWTFSAGSEYAYTFQFLNFSTEDIKDYVEIRTGSIEIKRFSGSKIPAEVLVVGNGSISFTSSEYVQLSGFRIRYRRVASVTTQQTARSTRSSTPSTLFVITLFTSKMVIL